jgi:catechol 2,3-dioxygenase-like lactoylglutathione lyase family enzyme
MLHHLVLWVPDLEQAERPWRWLFGRLGYEQDESFDGRLVFRHPDGLTVVLESSADMVPGMLYSRMRPGLNHLAFRVESATALNDMLAVARENGWSPLSADRHPIAQGDQVAYLEDADGFEVELVAPL